jgi:hypothetical protein
MAEANANAEIAKHLSDHGSHEGGGHADAPAKGRWRPEAVEILEAILLAIVAVVTAWSGYQAALWDGESAKEYALSSRYRAEGNEKALESNQYLAYNAGTLNAWITAMSTGNEKTAAVLEHRFTPNFKEAFDSWLTTDPLTNPDAPAGPGLMPEYEDPAREASVELNKEADHAFDLGVDFRLRAEHYVQVTVLLAAVLFLIALGQRFKFRGVRLAVILVAGVTLAYVLVLLVSYPRVL